jgi:RNA polymerase sigma-70 factor (ECF subfamily)
MASSPQSPVLSTPLWLRAGDDETNRTAEQIRENVTQLFVAHRLEICRYLEQRGCLATDAEEMTQEVFLRLYRALLTGLDVDAPRRWLFTVARNMAIDQVRRRRHHQHLTDVTTCDAAERVPDTAPTREDLMLSESRRVALAEALNELTDLQCECLHLRAEGLSLLEIGAIVNVSVSRASDAIRRAIRRLQKELDGRA